jgi:hypothetical protein
MLKCLSGQENEINRRLFHQGIGKRDYDFLGNRSLSHLFEQNVLQKGLALPAPNKARLHGGYISKNTSNQ